MSGGTAMLAGIKARAALGSVVVSDHAAGQLDKRDIVLAEMLDAIAGAVILETYPTYPKGPYCLIYGATAAGRPLHVVCAPPPCRN